MGDMTNEQSVSYLKKIGIDLDTANLIYSLVGGRLSLLQTMASELKFGVSFEDAKKSLFSTVDKKFKLLWTQLDASEELCYEKAFNLALQRPIFEITDLNISKNEKAMYSEIMKRLVAINILSDVGGGNYALHSILTKHFLEEMLKEIERKNLKEIEEKQLKEIEEKKHRWL